MSRWFAVSQVLLLVLGLDSCVRIHEPAEDVQADEQRIRARYASMDSLFMMDSMAAIASVYHDSARIVSYGRMIVGREDIRQYWGELTGSGVTWDHRIEELIIRGDRAIQYGVSDLRYRSGADTMNSLVRYTLIWKKDDTGEWWIERDHYTPIPRVSEE